MSRGLTTRLRKLEVKAKIGDSLGSLTDDQLFARIRDMTERLVDQYGGLEPAILALEKECGADAGAQVRKALNSTTTDEFMDRLPGWDAWKRQGVRAVGI